MGQFHLLFCSVFWISKAKNQLCDASYCKTCILILIQPLDPEILHKCPWPLSYSHGLGHFSSEHSRNSSELTLNLYSNQRVTCYCKTSFYHIFQFCANRNIVYFVEINFRMLVPTLLKHNFHILWLLIERSRGISVRGRIHFIILSLSFILGCTISSNILPLTLRSHSYWFPCFSNVEWSMD